MAGFDLPKYLPEAGLRLINPIFLNIAHESANLN